MLLRYAVILAAFVLAPFVLAPFVLAAPQAHAAREKGNAEAGQRLVMASCTTCHAPAGTTTASDAVPPLATLARDNKNDPTWTRAWLMDPHPPMEGIMLSRQQINDVVAYLNSLSAK